ncbi:MAG: bacteriohemerythrin [Clostridia bacterium]|nr:bacteriohemerythrin [Clostridia bacterium]
MFRWRDEFKTNVEEIDKQHKKLFEIGGRLYDLVSLGNQYDHYDEIMSILDELRKYTEYHFSYEEKLMQDQGYDKLDIHKIEHDFFIKKIMKLENLNIDENQEESLMKIITFVADWISSHIIKTDIQYKGFFNSKGVF